MGMKYPDFLVVGTARAGTTALHRMLRRHPLIFIPALKEPSFFAFDGNDEEYINGRFAFAVRNPDKYFGLFDSALPGQVAGEISTPYLYLYEQSIGSIRKRIPDSSSMKIIMILRDPADRAFSQYMWRVRDGREELSFESAIDQEQMRINRRYSFDYHYTRRGMYYEQVKAYKESFDNVHVVLYHDFARQPQRELSAICTFLGVDPLFPFDETKEVNNSYAPRYNWLSKAITFEHPVKYRMLNLMPDVWRDTLRRQLFRFNSDATHIAGMSPEMRKELVSFFRSDVERLEKLIGRDLASWKS